MGSISAWLPSRRSTLHQTGGFPMVRDGHWRSVRETGSKGRYFRAGSVNAFSVPAYPAEPRLQRSGKKPPVNPSHGSKSSHEKASVYLILCLLPVYRNSWRAGRHQLRKRIDVGARGIDVGDFGGDRGEAGIRRKFIQNRPHVDVT